MGKQTSGLLNWTLAWMGFISFILVTICMIACVDFNLFHSEEVARSLSLKKKKNNLRKEKHK